METLLWIVSTALMLALLGLLGLRALRELLDVKLPRRPRRGQLPLLLHPAHWHGAAIFLTSLAILWLAAFLSYVFLAGGAAGFWEHFSDRFGQAGDAYYYRLLAEDGYPREGADVNAIVFYPLYPLLIRLLRPLLGGRTVLTGMLLSQVCYGLSAVVLAALARKECTHPDAALAAYWLYPFGFFCLGMFTEGLFLLLAVLGLYLIRERRWVWAGAVGFLCALTRVQGVLLLLPGVYCAWRDCRKSRWNWKYLAAAGPLLGFAVYLCLNKAVCGDFLAFRYYESIEPWWQSTQWLGDTVAQQMRMGVQYYDSLSDWIYWPQLALYFIAAALLMAGYRRDLDTPYLLWGTAYLGMCYTASWLISGGRYMLGCLPLYLAVGRLKNPGLRALILLAELSFLALYTYLFMQAQAIM